MLSCKISVFKQNWLKVILCKKILLYKVCKQILGLSGPVPHTAAKRDMWQYWRVLASLLSGLDQSILELCWIFDTHVNSQFWPTVENPYFCKTILMHYFASHPFLLPQIISNWEKNKSRMEVSAGKPILFILSATFHPSSEPIFFIEFLYLKLTSYITHCTFFSFAPII